MQNRTKGLCLIDLWWSVKWFSRNGGQVADSRYVADHKIFRRDARLRVKQMHFTVQGSKAVEYVMRIYLLVLELFQCCLSKSILLSSLDL